MYNPNQTAQRLAELQMQGLNQFYNRQSSFQQSYQNDPYKLQGYAAPGHQPYKYQEYALGVPNLASWLKTFVHLPNVKEMLSGY